MAVSLLVSLTACANPDAPVISGDPSPRPTAPLKEEGYEVGEINQIEEISRNLMESFLLQVSVTVRGNLPDGCTEIAESTAELKGGTFTMSIITRRPKNVLCTQALVPFEETILLDVQGLSAGTYTVKVYNQTTEFTFGMDNCLPED